MSKIILIDGNLKLIKYSLKDLNNNLLIERYSKWFKNKKITEYLVKKDHRKKILKEFILRMILSDNDFFFKIVCNKKHIGNLRIANINFKRKTCGFGIVIGDPIFHNKKIATRSLILVLNFIFNNLNIRLLKFDCNIKNLKGMKLYKRLKFKKERHKNIKLVCFKMTLNNYLKNY